jgi:hypothetical protein
MKYSSNELASIREHEYTLFNKWFRIQRELLEQCNPILRLLLKRLKARKSKQTLNILTHVATLGNKSLDEMLEQEHAIDQICDLLYAGVRNAMREAVTTDDKAAMKRLDDLLKHVIDLIKEQQDDPVVNNVTALAIAAKQEEQEYLSLLGIAEFMAPTLEEFIENQRVRKPFTVCGLACLDQWCKWEAIKDRLFTFQTASEDDDKSVLLIKEFLNYELSDATTAVTDIEAKFEEGDQLRRELQQWAETNIANHDLLN